MTPAQCRAARALLQWSQDDLAREAGINAVTLRNYENGRTAAQRASIRVLRQALEKAGAVFLEGDPHPYPGVALSKIPSPSDRALYNLSSEISADDRHALLPVRSATSSWRTEAANNRAGAYRGAFVGRQHRRTCAVEL